MNHIKENYLAYLCAVVASISISGGCSVFIPFINLLFLILPVSLLGTFFIVKKKSANEEDKLIIQDLERLLAEQGDALKQREDILDEYEKIFDSQLVKLPCLCGGNTFEGLFSPNLDNIVECEKCKNKYRVEIAYNSVLLSEPLQANVQNFEKLVDENR
jgi:hypothetical protein